MAPSLTSMVLKAKAAPCLLLRLHWLLPRPSVLHAFGAESASHSPTRIRYKSKIKAKSAYPYIPPPKRIVGDSAYSGRTIGGQRHRSFERSAVQTHASVDYDTDDCLTRAM